MQEVCVLAATGMLGSGFSEDSFLRALQYQPDVIGCDSGSTDSGPYYLGSGKPNKSKKAIKHDLAIMIRHGVRTGIPVLVGSAGTSGGHAHLEWVLDIVREIAQEEALHFKMASIEAELEKETLRSYMTSGKMKELYPPVPFTEEMIDKIEHVVGVMGPEPFIEALKNGAQVVIAGRSSDTSIYSAVPIMKGFNNGPAWQAAKLLECGAGCAEQRMYPDCMLAWIREDSCSIEPPNPDMRCTPVSCVSHTLYENANPYELVEPGGILYTREAEYIAESDRRVRIEGCRFQPAAQYTVKLEGAYKAGYRQLTIGAIRDPLILRQLDSFLHGAEATIRKKVLSSLELSDADYQFQIRTYGKPPEDVAWEVCVIIETVAQTEELAHGIMALAWHTMLHHPIPEWSGLQSQVAFPFSPPSIKAGEVYQFCLNHVLEVDDPLKLFPITYHDL